MCLKHCPKKQLVCCFRFVSKALSQKTIGLLPEVGIILSAHCPINDFDPRIKTEPVTAGCECNVICPAFAVISNDAGAPTVTGTGFIRTVDYDYFRYSADFFSHSLTFYRINFPFFFFGYKFVRPFCSVWACLYIISGAGVVSRTPHSSV